MRGKLVLVTGAGGFIGSHLAERLVAEGAQVRAFVHYNALGRRGWLDESDYCKEMDIVAGDICDRDSVRRAIKDVEIVFHLAALIAIPYSYQAPSSYVRTNVEGTLNVLQAAADQRVERVVHTSTSEVYGNAQFVPMKEDHPLRAQSPYSASKIGADKLAEAFHLSYGLPVISIRPFNTFGPRQSARAVVPTIISQCLSGTGMRLGNTHPKRDLNYVSNTVDGYILASSAAEAVGKTINIGSGREISIGELVNLVGHISKRDVHVEVAEERLRPGTSEVDRLLADNSQAAHILGWSPRVSLEEGLSITIEWMRRNMKSYRSDVYTI